MIQNIIYIILAILGISFIIFIHELGHFIAAKKSGMKIEVFSIGFGKALFSWKHKGVTWKIGFLPFGGYVKISGMQKENDKEPKDIPNGFFSKSPLTRMKVAISGPLVNIIFGFIGFALLWSIGGREKDFSEYTKKIGWIDYTSNLYDQGIRPGDTIEQINDKKIKDFKDILYFSFLNTPSLKILGNKINYYDNEKKENFDITIQTHLTKEKLRLLPFLPAQYLLYVNSFNPAITDFEKNDRILWVDGELIFSMKQLNSIINQSMSFITIKRKDTIFHTKVARVKVEDLYLTTNEKEDLKDLKHNLPNNNIALNDLFFIPYKFNSKGEIEKAINFLDETFENKILNGRSKFFTKIEKNDKIIAIDGKNVTNNLVILDSLQTRKVNVIVQRNNEKNLKVVDWKKADQNFMSLINMNALNSLINSIGLYSVNNQDNLYLLNSMEPKSLTALSKTNIALSEGLKQTEEAINSITNEEKKHIEEEQLDIYKNSLALGINLQDNKVKYNPNPFSLTYNTVINIYDNFKALFTGKVNVKWAGVSPIGMVQIIQHSWFMGYREVIFLLSLISLYLGIINLLPIPLLDGGHILFSTIELITKKQIKAKTMERLVIPFFILIIISFIYFTYNDLARIFLNSFNYGQRTNKKFLNNSPYRSWQIYFSR